MLFEPAKGVCNREENVLSERDKNVFVSMKKEQDIIKITKGNRMKMFLEIKKKKTSKKGLDFKAISRKHSKAKEIEAGEKR